MKITFRVIALMLAMWAVGQFAYLGNPLAPCAHAQTQKTPPPNPNCPHHKAVEDGRMQDSTNCAPPSECICQAACQVLCKP